MTRATRRRLRDLAESVALAVAALSVASVLGAAAFKANAGVNALIRLSFAADRVAADTDEVLVAARNAGRRERPRSHKADPEFDPLRSAVGEDR